MNLMNRYFITGTDTDVGKTFITSLLMKFVKKQKHKVLGFKPIAAGAEYAFGELVNEDALTLLESGNVSVQYKLINPYIYEQAIAPHIASKIEDETITVEGINKAYSLINNEITKDDYLFTEGAGGWALPINDKEYLYDWVCEQNIPVVLVVGLKLGCLNHALLTQAHMKSLSINCVGWIANHIDPNMAMQQQNIESLKERLNMPLLAVAPFHDKKSNSMPKLQIYKALKAVLNLE